MVEADTIDNTEVGQIVLKIRWSIFGICDHLVGSIVAVPGHHIKGRVVLLGLEQFALGGSFSVVIR